MQRRQQPVHVTWNPTNLWRGEHAEVGRQGLRAGYPKHYWPENPLDAEPTRGVRRRH